MLRVNAKKNAKKSVDYWKDFVKDNFEDIKKSLLKVEDERKYQVSEDSDDDSDEDRNEVEDCNEEKTRTFSTSLNSVIRTDLTLQVKQVFMDTVNTRLEQISSYIPDFSLKIFEISLMFADKSFASTGNQFEIVPQPRKYITQILPHGYLQEDITVTNPPDAQLLKNEVFASNYNQLFQDPHLELTHST
ncbi:hypothetical protein HPULCUR_008620 [Helicostylum pulchrum]|uniref:Uncharacterized protein n=1 Tax=Helicostylum pulchrum TaxID=562976 RepID=A0ABP9Y836_9FUNG